MSKPLKPRRGTTAEHASFIGLAHEVTYDTDKNTLVTHDGVTPGGFPLAQEGDIASLNSTLRALIAKEVGEAESAASSQVSALETTLRTLIQQELAKKLSLSGGTMTGELLSSVSNEGNTNLGGATKEQIFVLSAGPDGIYGASSLTFFPYNHASYPGYIRIRANNQVRGYDLWLKTDGTASWNDNDILTTASGTAYATTRTPNCVTGYCTTSFTLPSGGTWKYMGVGSIGSYLNTGVSGTAAGGSKIQTNWSNGGWYIAARTA
ncbi:hyaluronate lyase N-terminal domain-containing protein [Mailhella sp.]